MPPGKAYLRFVLRFALVFALLALPWPYWQDAWRGALRTVADCTLTRPSGSREVSVAVLQPAFHMADLRFTVVNRELMNADGSGPVRNLDFSAAQIEMRPMALWFALIFATPLPWKRRAWHLIAGVVLLQVGILAILSFCVWRESMELLLVTASPGMKTMATAVRDGLVQYFGLVLPFLIWLPLCIRSRAARSWLSPSRPELPIPGPQPCKAI